MEVEYLQKKARAFPVAERLWRSVKYEEVYLKPYGVVDEARHGLRDYFTFYNTGRLHQSPGYQTPVEVISVTRRLLRVRGRVFSGGRLLQM